MKVSAKNRRSEPTCNTEGAVKLLKAVRRIFLGKSKWLRKSKSRSSSCTVNKLAIHKNCDLMRIKTMLDLQSSKFHLNGMRKTVSFGKIYTGEN